MGGNDDEGGGGGDLLLLTLGPPASSGPATASLPSASAVGPDRVPCCLPVSPRLLSHRFVSSQQCSARGRGVARAGGIRRCLLLLLLLDGRHRAAAAAFVLDLRLVSGEESSRVGDGPLPHCCEDDSSRQEPLRFCRRPVDPERGCPRQVLHVSLRFGGQESRASARNRYLSASPIVMNGSFHTPLSPLLVTRSTVPHRWERQARQSRIHR